MYFCVYIFTRVFLMEFTCNMADFHAWNTRNAAVPLACTFMFLHSYKRPVVVADTFAVFWLLKKGIITFFRFICFSCPETNAECLRLAVSLVKVIYWLLIVVTRLLKLCIEVCMLCCFASSCLRCIIGWTSTRRWASASGQWLHFLSLLLQYVHVYALF